MTELAVQNYLRTPRNTLESLKENYRIRYNFHETFTNLVGFSYSLLDEPDFSNKINQECRGIILDASNNFNVVARGYDKFFNRGEPLAPTLDYELIRVYEKWDGTCILLSYYNDSWLASTLGVPGASSFCDFWRNTFSSLFWKTFQDLGYRLPTGLGVTDYTFIFELCTPWNEVVVHHKSLRLILTGARHTSDGRELFPKEVVKQFNTNWEIPSLKYLRGVDAVNTYVSEEISKFSGIEREGFVLVDQNFNRLKVKNPEYVELHHRLDKFGFKAVLSVVINNEIDEVIQYHPRIVKPVERAKKSSEFLVKYLGEILAHFRQHKDAGIDRKEIAGMINTTFDKNTQLGRTTKHFLFLALYPKDDLLTPQQYLSDQLQNNFGSLKRLFTELMTNETDFNSRSISLREEHLC